MTLRKAWVTEAVYLGRTPIVLVTESEGEARTFATRVLRRHNDELGRDLEPLAKLTECLVLTGTERSASDHALILRDYLTDVLSGQRVERDEDINRTVTAFMEAYHEARVKERQPLAYHGLESMVEAVRNARDGDVIPIPLDLIS